MKILEVIYTLERGGAERFAVDLCNEFEKQGHEVTLMVIRKGGETSPYLKYLSQGVKFVCLGADADSRLKAIWTMLRMFFVLLKVRADVIHCHLFALQLCAFAIALDFRRIPFFYTVHSDAYLDAGTYLWFNRILFRLPNLFPVTISPTSRKSFLDAYHGRPSTLIVNGCHAAPPTEEQLAAARTDLDSWRFYKDGVLFINLARVTEPKNQLEMVAAAEECVKKNIHLDIIIMGETANQSIADKILEKNLPFIHLTGPKDAPLRFLAQADALLLPSVQEGMPMSLLECFSVSKPACVTAVGGMKDFVTDSVNGLVSNGTTSDGIAEMLTRFCSLDKQARDRMGANAYHIFEEHTLERCAESYIAAFASPRHT